MENNLEPKIIFEDDEVLVLDKPAGLTVNNSETTGGERTVQDWLEEKFTIDHLPLTIDRESDFYQRAGIVHRIDKETSGILLVAKTPQAFENLQKQFKERQVKKTYQALAHGKVIPAEGEISVPVGRLPWNRTKFGILAGGKESITKYRTIFKFQFSNSKKTEDLTFLELYPETGRTHQIRVHLKFINRPIFSDYLYAGRKVSKNDRKILNRVFLHAHKISFQHPKTGETISFESPLPVELEDLLSKLNKVQ